MQKQVACEFDGCSARVPLDEFDESVWLPVFKASREQVGFFCPAHVAEIRGGAHAKRYLISRADPDELIIDMEPLTAEQMAMLKRPAPELG